MTPPNAIAVEIPNVNAPLAPAMRLLLCFVLVAVAPAVAAAQGPSAFADALERLRSDHAIALHSLRFMGDAEHRMSAFSEVGTDHYVGACRSQPRRDRPNACQPRLYRLAPDGSTRWHTVLDSPGRFLKHEVRGVVTHPSGDAIVALESFREPGINGIWRFFRINSNGRRVWRVQLQGNGRYESPYPLQMWNGPEGAVWLQGFLTQEVSQGANRPRHMRWTATLSPDGNLENSLVGTPLSIRFDPPPMPEPFGRFSGEAPASPPLLEFGAPPNRIPDLLRDSLRPRPGSPTPPPETPAIFD